MTLEQALARLGANDPDKPAALQLLARELLPVEGDDRWQRAAARCFSNRYGWQDRLDMALDALGNLILRFANATTGYVTDNASAYLRTCITNEARRLSIDEAKYQERKQSPSSPDERNASALLENREDADHNTPEEFALFTLGDYPNLAPVTAQGLVGVAGWVSALLKEKVIPLLTRSDTRDNTTAALDVMLRIHNGDASQHSIVFENHPGWTTTHPEFDKELNNLQQQCSRARRYLTRELDKLTHAEFDVTEAEFDFVYAFIASL
jgi:hypothetical protein